jgi:glycosyltransferase involved in cell wall biosynthesis
MDLRSLDVLPFALDSEAPVILWNHRWEYDKDPELFFHTLFELSQAGQDFKLVVLGEAFRNSPPVFGEAREQLADHMLHFGYARDRHTYARWLQTADLLPVTSKQDFFGGSVVEAIYAGCYPLLPDRLAFPEHIPADRRPAHLYQKDEELLPSLLAVVPQIKKQKHNRSYRNFVAHYDWCILAGDYDQRLEQLRSSKYP